jgi:hypothetical protein
MVRMAYMNIGGNSSLSLLGRWRILLGSDKVRLFNIRKNEIFDTAALKADVDRFSEEIVNKLVKI